MKIQITKQNLVELFESSKSYQEIAETLSTETVIINEKMVKEMFKAQGFNLRNRKRKSDETWFEIVEETEELV